MDNDARKKKKKRIILAVLIISVLGVLLPFSSLFANSQTPTSWAYIDGGGSNYDPSVSASQPYTLGSTITGTGSNTLEVGGKLSPMQGTFNFSVTVGGQGTFTVYFGDPSGVLTNGGYINQPLNAAPTTYTGSATVPNGKYVSNVYLYNGTPPTKFTVTNISISNYTVAGPNVPTGLTASGITQTQATLSWSASTGAKTYSIYENGGSSGLFTGISSTSKTITGLTPGTNYTFTVTATDNSGIESGQSAAAGFTTLPVPPTSPTGLTTSNVGQSSITLNWNSVSSATSYNVYQDGGSTPILTGIAGTSTNVTGLSPNTSYSFSVTAVNAGGESPASSSATAQTLPPPPVAPTGLQSSNVTATSFTVSWTAVPGSSYYNLFLNGATTPTQTNVTATTADFTNLKESTTYTVTVQAVDTYGQAGALSSPLSVTTKSAQPVPPTNVSSSGTNGGPGTITWTPSPTAPSGSTYTVYQNGQPVGTTTGSSLPVSKYNPNSPYVVTASYGGTETPQSQSPSTGGLINSTGWGFSGSDVWTNAENIVISVGPYLLLLLAVIFAPQIRDFIFKIFRKIRGRWTI